MRDVKPILAWAKARGDEKIVERIIVRLLPDLTSHGLELSSARVEGDAPILVPEDIYARVERVARQFIAQDPESGGHVRHQ